MKGRIDKLERHVYGPDGQPPCPACGGIMPHFLTTAYVDPLSDEKYNDPPAPDPCEVCGRGPFLIISGCIQPLKKPLGVPPNEAVMMTCEESARWHSEHGNPALAEWFAGRAGQATNHPLSEYKR